MPQQQHLFTKKGLYWLCQIGGWTAFVLYSIWAYSFVINFTEKVFLNALLNIVLGITVTDYYRSLVLQKGWLQLPINRLIPRILLGVTVMSFVMILVNLPLDIWMFPELDLKLGLSQLFFGMLNWSKYVLIWTLLYHIFQFYEQFSLAEKDKIHLESLVVKSQLQNLRNQVNPHFLFNALNSIKALVDEDPIEAKKAIAHVSSLLRKSLKAENQPTIDFKDELQTVNDYIILEQIRFEERLQFNHCVDDQTLNLQIPPFLLQTLVENAVKHGISKTKKGGLITLQSTILENFHCIYLTNNGTVLPNIENNGLGMQNSRERLRLLFGKTAEITLENTDENTVCTTIKIPIIS